MQDAVTPWFSILECSALPTLVQAMYLAARGGKTCYIAQNGTQTVDYTESYSARAGYSYLYLTNLLSE